MVLKAAIWMPFSARQPILIFVYVVCVVGCLQNSTPGFFEALAASSQLEDSRSRSRSRSQMPPPLPHSHLRRPPHTQTRSPSALSLAGNVSYYYYPPQPHRQASDIAAFILYSMG